MEVRNCRKCGRIFNYVAGPIYCQSCREELEKKFQSVKTYIRENPGVSIQEVSETCDVPTSQIHQWLREERLQLADGSAITLECEGCGGAIQSGRYCDRCKKELTTGFRQSIRPNLTKPEPVKKQDDAKSKMRFL